MKHEHEQQWNDEDDEQPVVEQATDEFFRVRDYAMDYVLDEGLVEFGADKTTEGEEK